MTSPNAAQSPAAAFNPATGSVRGRFLWYELTTSDVDASLAFYKEVMGWSSVQYEGMEPPYTMFTLGENPVAGVFALSPEMRDAGVPPNWMPYVGAEDIDAAVRDATGAGASTMLAPLDVPGVGRVAVMGDPQGAPFGLYQPASAAPPEREPLIGEASWHELLTTDLDPAFAFYTSAFGWRMTSEMEMAPNWLYRMFGRSETPLGGMMAKGEGMEQVPSHWQLYFRVADVTAAIETVKRLGGTLLRGPEEVPGGSLVANMVDPQGAAFSLHEVRNG